MKLSMNSLTEIYVPILNCPDLFNINNSNICIICNVLYYSDLQNEN